MASTQTMEQVQWTEHFTLNKFIGKLKSLTGPAELKNLKNWLSQLSTDDPELQRFQQFSEEKCQRNLVAEGPWFEALLLCFESGQQTPIHDHAGSACGVLVVQGTATETEFKSSFNGRLNAMHSHQLNEGGVAGSVDMDIHKLSNSQPRDTRLVTLHIYSPPLGEVGNYNIADGTYQTVKADRNRTPK